MYYEGDGGRNITILMLKVLQKKKLINSDAHNDLSSIVTFLKTDVIVFPNCNPGSSD